MLGWLRAPDWERFELNRRFLSQIRAYIDDSTLSDINGDGHLDFVMGTSRHGGGWPSEIYWLENPGGTTTERWRQHRVAVHPKDAYHPADVVVGDLDQDGKPDIVTKDLFDRNSFRCTMRIYFQNGPDSWMERSWKTDYREGMLVADLDGDTRPDILCNGYWYATPSNPRTQEFPRYDIDPFHYSQDNDANGLSNSTKNAVGDINGDGRKDVVLATAEGQAGYIAWYEASKHPRSQSWSRHKIADIRNCHGVSIDFIAHQSFRGPWILSVLAVTSAGGLTIVPMSPVTETEKTDVWVYSRIKNWYGLKVRTNQFGKIILGERERVDLERCRRTYSLYRRHGEFSIPYGKISQG